LSDNCLDGNVSDASISKQPSTQNNKKTNTATGIAVNSNFETIEKDN